MLAILRSVQGPTQVQPHCLACELYEEHDYSSAVLYLEKWDSEDAFQEHVRSELYRRILAAMELSKAQPEQSFHQVAATQGFELVKRLRGSNEADSQ